RAGRVAGLAPRRRAAPEPERGAGRGGLRGGAGHPARRDEQLRRRSGEPGEARRGPRSGAGRLAAGGAVVTVGGVGRRGGRDGGGPLSGILIAGTTSDAGKSLVTAGICRWLARGGVRV